MSIAIARGLQHSAALPAGGWPRAVAAPTYGAMAILPPTVGPRAALKDLTAFLRQRSREQIIGASLAVLVTIIIVIIFFVDSKINTAPPEQVIYVENFPANRTDEQIIADQKQAQIERRKAEEARRKEFEKLQERLGIE
jgi:H+/gluconate symporter-like permease